MWGHPSLCHRLTSFCPCSLSLYPTWTIINLSLRFELCHLPPSSTPIIVITVTCPCWPKEESQRSPAPCVPSRIQSGFQESGLWRAAVHDSWCLGWHPLVLMCSGPEPPIS